MLQGAGNGQRAVAGPYDPFIAGFPAAESLGKLFVLFVVQKKLQDNLREMGNYCETRRNRLYTHGSIA